MTLSQIRERLLATERPITQAEADEIKTSLTQLKTSGLVNVLTAQTLLARLVTIQALIPK